MTIDPTRPRSAYSLKVCDTRDGLRRNALYESGGCDEADATLFQPSQCGVVDRAFQCHFGLMLDYHSTADSSCLRQSFLFFCGQSPDFYEHLVSHLPKIMNNTKMGCLCTCNCLPSIAWMFSAAIERRLTRTVKGQIRRPLRKKNRVRQRLAWSSSVHKQDQ